MADYVRIRPALVLPGGGIQDFALRIDCPVIFLGGDADSRRMLIISLLGIERPELTSSLAIPERVINMLLQEHS